jgi:L-fuculose-phosphate aldolase
MDHIEAALRTEICTYGRRLYERGLIVAGDGNLSCRLPDGTFLMTPAGLAKAELVPADLVVIDDHGTPIRAAADRRPSSEYRLHLAVYRERPDVQACIHAHPPTAVGATLAGVDLTAPLLPELLIALGPLPTAPYALTGTDEMDAAVRDLVGAHQAVLLAYHGAVTYGASVAQAFHRMEQVESCARIVLAAIAFGGIRPLPADRVAELDRVRAAFLASGRI